MTSRSGWGQAERAEEAADISLGSAQVAQQAAAKVMDALPTPDPRQDPNFQRLAGLEQSMLARLSPRHKNRWPELSAIDERLHDLDRRQGELTTTLADLRGRRDHADDEYAATIARWMTAGQPDPKPIPETRALEDAITEAAAEYGAMDLLRQEVLAEKVAFVEKHRARLVADRRRRSKAGRAPVRRRLPSTPLTSPGP